MSGGRARIEVGAETPSDEDDDDDFGQVIVSLTVVSPTAIAALSAFERDPGTSDDLWYQLGTTSFVEHDTQRRLDALERAVSTLLDLLSDVPRAILFDDATFVRLFITFGRGAQTLSSALVQRIAEVNATIWIDA